MYSMQCSKQCSDPAILYHWSVLWLDLLREWDAVPTSYKVSEEGVW